VRDAAGAGQGGGAGLEREVDVSLGGYSQQKKKKGGPWGSKVIQEGRTAPRGRICSVVLVSARLYKAAELVTFMLPPTGAAMVVELTVKKRTISDMNILRCFAIDVYVYLFRW
jgi:hypothetical protein